MSSGPIVAGSIRQRPFGHSPVGTAMVAAGAVTGAGSVVGGMVVVAATVVDVADGRVVADATSDTTVSLTVASSDPPHATTATLETAMTTARWRRNITRA